MAEILKDKFTDGVILKLSGQFTGNYETDEFEEIMNGILKSDNRNVIVDLTNVNFLSSIAIGKMLKFHSEFNENEGKVVYCGFNSIIQGVLKSTRVWNIFNVTDDLKSAMLTF